MIDEREVREMLRRRAAGVRTGSLDTTGALRRARRRLLGNGVAAAVVVAVIALGTLVGADAVRDAAIPATPIPSPSLPPGTADANGWPDTSRNPPGLYSWDGQRCGVAGSRSSCNVGFMHNGYGSGTVKIRVAVVPQGVLRIPPQNFNSAEITRRAAVVAGLNGSYRRDMFGHLEEWLVDIDGTPIDISVTAKHAASRADLADAHAIVHSMRVEQWDNDLGFRLVFTLTNGDWDSG